MQPTESEHLVVAWLEFQRNWWAHGALDELCSNDPESAWSVLLRIISLAGDDEMLETIGAGPLEDLLRAHGTVLIDRIEHEASTNPKLRKALSSVWLPRSDDSTTRRMVALGCDLLKQAT